MPSVSAAIEAQAVTAEWQTAALGPDCGGIAAAAADAAAVVD